MTTPNRNLAGALACTLLALALPVRAADNIEQIRKQALLRGYTTAEAERRYSEQRVLVRPSTTGGALAGAANALAGIAARNQARSDAANRLKDQMYEAVERGQDFKMETVGEVEAMREMLDYHASGDDYRWPARKRLIEMALHQRRQAEQLFTKPDYAFAAVELRKNAYADKLFHPWSAWMLAKLYLMGAGVPADEGEAADLLQVCTEKDTVGFTDPGFAEVGCHVLLAEMHSNGWGFPASAEKAAQSMAKARDWHKHLFGQSITDAQLRERFR